MDIKQYYLGCLSHASYMIADEKSKTAVVVDPQRDVDQYVRDAEARGLRISDVVLTHFHADFVAGHLELQERTGARIHLGEKARPEYDFQARKEGEVLEFGNTRLQFLETPGHTPEAISLLAYDLGKDPNKPLAVLTGDTLFVGDVGRPDLAVATGHAPEDLAGQLYDSLHHKLLTLPEDTTVYPAHGPGSSCGSGGLQGKVSTIGQEKAHNPMLLLSSKAEFVQQLTGHSAAPPAYFSHDAVLNQIERPTLEENLQVQHRPLTLEQAREHIQQGATVLDVRHPDEFVAGHYPGSVNIGLDGRFAEWAGSVIDLEKPVLVIAPPGREEEAIVRLNRVGFEDIAGYLPILPDEFTATQPRIQAAELARQLQGPAAPLVFDVRTPAEFAKGHLPGARNVPLQQLADQIPTEGPVVIHCQSGYRSSIATSLIGPREGLTELEGGYLAWTQAGLPVERT